MSSATIRKAIFAGLICVFVCTIVSPPPAGAAAAKRTEDFLNILGVNTHMDGNSGWDTNAANVGAHLKYLGVRLERDWPSSSGEGSTFKSVQSNWSSLGRLWTSIGEDSPTGQRNDLSYDESIYGTYGTGLIYTIGGPNEEDDSYPQGLGATLPDSATVQGMLYSWAHSSGRNIPVSQMEFGAGWTANNNWQGDYNPSDTGIGENYTPGGADYGGAHTYISNTSQTPASVLNTLRSLANLTTPGKPVAHTEFGDYFQNSTSVWGQYCVMGAFDAFSAGDVGYIVYGLQDSDAMGFYDSSDSNPNPVANYYNTLTTLLASSSGSYGPGQTPTYTPGSLNVSYSNTTTASHLLLQKYTGEYVIADWSEQLMNGSQTSVSDTVNFGEQFGTVKIYDVESGTTPIKTLSNASSYTITMNPSDTYLFILSNPSGGQTLLPNGTYTIANKSNGNIACLSSANIGAGIMQGSAGSLDTSWTVTNLGNNVVEITNATVSGCMGCSSTNLNAGLILQNYTGATTQQWQVTEPTSGCYVFKSLETAGYVADIYSGLGTQLLADTANGGTTQEWVLTPVSQGYLIPNGTYTITNRSTGYIACLASANIGAGIMQGQSGSLDTSWTVTNLGNNVIEITNATVNGCMGCSSTGLNAGLILQTYSGASTQQWKVSQPASGWFTLTSLESTGYVADIYSGLGTQLLADTASGSTTQQWSFH